MSLIGIGLSVLHRQRQQTIAEPGLLEPLSFRRSSRDFVGVASAFGQEPVFVPRMVADDDALAREVEDGYAGADGEGLAWEGGGNGFGGLEGHRGAMLGVLNADQRSIEASVCDNLFVYYYC